MESGLNLKWRGVWAVYGFVCFSQFYFGFVIKFGELLRKNNNLKGKNRRETPENLLNIADFSNAAAQAFPYRFRKVREINEMKDNLTLIDFTEIQQVAEKNC